MSERSFVGMLLSEEDLCSRSEDERSEYAMIKELGEDYKDKTFQEVAEDLAEDLEDLSAQQRETANKTKSMLECHNKELPQKMICYFIAYKEDEEGVTAVRDVDGNEERNIEDKIRPYIDTRTLPSGEEYDCIDIVIGLIGGCD